MSRIISLLALLAILIVLALSLASSTQAMPEYATRVGEPCGTCHVSPAGGGVRNARGQAWVAENKPSVVPSMLDALKVLGVQLPSDMTIYTNAPATPGAAAPLPGESQPLAPLRDKLSEREGT